MSDLDRTRFKREINEIVFLLLLYQLVQFATVFGLSSLRTLWKVLTQRAGVSIGDSGTFVQGESSFGALSSMIGFTLGFLILAYRMRDRVPIRQIFKRGRRMNLSTFLQFFVLFMCGQTVFSLSAAMLDRAFRFFGYSLADSVERATSVDPSIPMWVYVGFFAPLMEEMVYRGFLLQSVRPYGKRFAVLFSAMMFGGMHANLPQSIFALYIGMVLGYIAIEYGIGYTILFHFLNNFVFGSLLGFLVSENGALDLTEVWYRLDLVFVSLGLGILFCKRRVVWNGFCRHHPSKGLWRTVFRSPAFLIFLLLEGMLALSLIHKI